MFSIFYAQNLCFVVVVCPIEVEIFSPIPLSFFFRRFANQEFFLFGIFIFLVKIFFSQFALCMLFLSLASHILPAQVMPLSEVNCGI